MVTSSPSLKYPSFSLDPIEKKKKDNSRRVPSKQMKFIKVPCDFWIAWQPFRLSLLRIESSSFPLVVACMHDFT